ncbi:MAG: hypothetical protein ACTSWA_05260 [Candidatus Thorarchaeota archaeon]
MSITRTTITQARVYIETQIFFDFYPEDFEGSDLSWEEFLNKVIGELDYRKETFISNLLDLSESVISNIVKGVEKNEFQVLVKVKRDKMWKPETVRDE